MFFVRSKMQSKLRTISLAISFLAFPLLLNAQTLTLKQAAQKAMESNPEVLARWHNFKSAISEREATFGGYLPNVNLSTSAGRENRENRLTSSELSRNSTTLSLNQMIYDGFLTRNEVKRFDHMRLVRLYEFYDAAENISLEVYRAYLDVNRFRKLVSLSEDNYVRHRAVFEQIQMKSKAGVSRRVDLEQISGRLALAESNLLTETSNLHDVSARFQRLVGIAPTKELESVPFLVKGMPKDPVSAFNEAFRKSPSLLASIENIRATNSGLSARKSAYQPRVDFKARTERGNNIDNTTGRTTNSSAEFVLSWNLFNGGSDKARIQQTADQLNLAKDGRDKTCRDIRQTLAIAFNDTLKLTDQLNYLDQHQLSIEKARDAYRQQFDIGQRSLLDLLDTENELFQAKRAFANAEIDLSLAYARTHASIGTLNSSLEISRTTDDGAKQLEMENPKDEFSQNCAIEIPDLYTINKTALNARAADGINQIIPTAAAQAISPVASPVAAQVEVAPTKSVEATARNTVLNALKTWREAWISMNSEAYFSFYAPKYTSRESWKAARKARLTTAQRISLDLSDIAFVMQDAKHATSSFQQSYRSANYQDTLQKTLHWEEIGGKWLIVNETVSGPHAKQW
jgi:adhesin transport system outer membrane protein